MFLKTRAIVLRDVKYKEADKILTLLSEAEGKIAASAHGAMGSKSRLAAVSQPLTYSEFLLEIKKDRYTVKEANVIEPFFNLRNDISSFSLGCYFAECVDAFCIEGSNDGYLSRLLLNSLYALCNKLYPSNQIKASFELKLMVLTGYSPDLDSCAFCKKIEPEEIHFCYESGNICCNSCYVSECGPWAPLNFSVLNAMRFVIKSGLKSFLSFRLSEQDLIILERVCEIYFLSHSGRSFNTLDYWKRIKD